MNITPRKKEVKTRAVLMLKLLNICLYLRAQKNKTDDLFRVLVLCFIACIAHQLKVFSIVHREINSLSCIHTDFIWYNAFFEIGLPKFHFLGEAPFLKSCLNEKDQIRQHNWRRKIHSLKQNVLFIEDCQSDEFCDCDGLLSAGMSNRLENIVHKLIRYFVRIEKHFVLCSWFWCWESDYSFFRMCCSFFIWWLFMAILVYLHKKNKWKRCVIEVTNCSFLIL